jgi:hypothetical protein
VTRVVFIGDADVGVNADFSRAMVALASALPSDVALAVIVPGLTAPAKGFDDLREALGADFGAYWEQLRGSAIPVARGTAWESLAATLLKRESPAALRDIVNLSSGETA